MQASSAASPFANGTRVGQFLFRDVTAGVIPQQVFDFLDTDGIVGLDLLQNAGAILFDGLTASVIIGGNLTEVEREQIGFSSDVTASVPLNVMASTLFTVPITLENNGISRQMDLMLDTGSASTIVSHEAAMALRLIAIGTSSDSVGIVGSQKINKSAVDMLKIGTLVVHNALVNYPSSDNEASSSLQPKGQATERIGMDILLGYRVLVDFSARRMYIMSRRPDKTIIKK